MPSASDAVEMVRRVGFIPFARRVISEVNNDSLFTWAAALAYSWLFAVFPFFLFLLALLPHLPEYAKSRAKDDIHQFVEQSLPSEAARLVWSNLDGNLDNFLHKPQGKLLYVALAIALYAASGGMAATMAAIDRCYEVEECRPFLRHRAFALLLTILAVLLLLADICLLPVGTLFSHWALEHHMIPRLSLIIFNVARWVLSVLCMFALLSLVYHSGPSIRQRFRWITPGSIFCVAVWVILAIAFRIYIDRTGERGYERTYGTVAGVAILLLFFYIDALVLLIGAEINSEIDFELLKVRRGDREFRPSHIAKPQPAATLAVVGFLTRPNRERPDDASRC